MSRPVRAAFPASRFPGATGVVVVLMLAALLAGCGKKGNPVPPPGEPNTYPRAYPNPNPTPDTAPPR